MVDAAKMLAACQAAVPGDTVEHLGTGGFGSTFKVGSSPQVAAYRQVGEVTHDGATLRWLAMEFVDGVSPNSLVRGGRCFNVAEAVDLLQQMVEDAAAI